MNQNDIFHKEGTDHVESPEQMDSYIKAAGPGIWIVLAALLILLVSAVVWSITGTLPETLEIKGCTATDGSIYCYLPSDTEYLSLNGCAVNGTLPDGTIVTGYVEAVSEQPFSKEEIGDMLESDWLAENLLAGTYSYEVIVHTEERLKENMLASVVITVDEVKPIEFMIN